MATTTKGTSGFHKLRVDCVIGVYDHERVGPQTIYVDLEGDYDWTRAAASDDIAEAVDYDGLARLVTEVAAAGRFALLETLAARVAEACLAQSPLLEAVRITLTKPAAIEAAEGSFVRFELRRG